MKRFKLVNLVLLVILSSLIVAVPVLAATYDYALAFSVKDTGGTARTYVPVLTGIGYTGLNTAGYATSATGVVVYNGTTAVTAMVGTTQTAIVLPSLPASNTQSLNLYTDYSVPWATQPIIPGYNGYITTTDAAALEWGNNGEANIRGYFFADVAGNLLNKTDATRLVADGAGNVSASVATIYSQAVSVAPIPMYTGAGNKIRVSQKFTNVPQGDITSVTFYLSIVGNPAGSAYARLRKVADDSIIGTFGSIVANTIAGAETAYTFSTAVTNPATQDCYVSIEYDDGGDAGNYVAVYYDSPAGGDANGFVSWFISGGAWVDQPPGADLRYSFTEYTTAATVTVTGITTGIRRFNPEITGGNLTLNAYDGSDVLIDTDTVAFAGSVPDNANNWVIMSNATSYLTYYKHDVGGAQVVWYEPNAVITGTALPDREGAAQNGVFTFGANSNITVTMGGFTSYASVAGSSPATGTADTFQDADMPTGWFATGTGAALPFYSDFNTAATGMGISTQSLYIIMMMAVALAVGLMAGIMTGSWLIGTIGIGVMILAGVGTDVMPVWVLFIYAVMGGGILYLSKQT